MEKIPIGNNIPSDAPKISEMETEKIIITEMDKRYQERKSEITTKDEDLYMPILEIIDRYRKTEESIREEYADASMAHVSGGELFFQILTENMHEGILSLFLAEGRPLINIGSGGSDKNIGFTGKIDIFLRPSKQELVDPFFDQSDTEKRIETFYKFIKDRILFIQDDGLHNLISRSDKSGNVLISTVNTLNMYATVGRENMYDWLSRVAQEAYRVIPDDGVLICIDSDDIAEEAEKIFGKDHKIEIGGGFHIFVKGDYKKFINEHIERLKMACQEITFLLKEAKTRLSPEELSSFNDLKDTILHIFKDEKLCNLTFGQIKTTGRIIAQKYFDLEENFRENDKRTQFAKHLLETWNKNFDLGLKSIKTGKVA